MSKISLLVPCYNAAKYLPRLMQSVRAQTVHFSNILCYDDASTDNTCEVARELGLTLLRGETNRGPAFARNRLLDAAQGEWIHFHDADDLLDPLFVEKMSALLTATVDVAVCNMDWVVESTRELEIPWRYSAEELAQDPLDANLRNPVGVIACVFRTECLRRIGGFDERWRTWEDANLQVRLSQAGARYLLHSETLVIGLRHGSGASSNSALMSECQIDLLETYARTLPERYRATIAAEAEKLAAWLLYTRLHSQVVERCLRLCRTLDWRVPSTSQPLLRLARLFLPARWLLAWQMRHRRSRPEEKVS
jgi:GT2 family glycosyltransferase